MIKPDERRRILVLRRVGGVDVPLPAGAHALLLQYRIRARRRASRELDGRDDSSALTHVVGDPYRDTHLDKTWPERDALGQDLAEAGWTP